MPISSELHYANEEGFAQDFLIPMLQKLGFLLVINTHGRTEFGRDLVFSEVDRFGHVKYHGLQAKYVASISLNGIEDLVRDCKQAFENPFAHPQTGTSERISSFYVATAGSVGPEASQHYFNSLLKLYAGNVRLLQGKDLVVLDRWASTARRERVVELLSGLLVELNYNEKYALPSLLSSMRELQAGTGTWALWRLRADTASSYLREPFMTSTLNVDRILNYWHLALLCNKQVDLVGQGILAPGDRLSLTANAIDNLTELQATGVAIRSDILAVLQSLGVASS